MYIDRNQCRKARVIRETVHSDGVIKRETLIEKGVAFRFTNLGAFVYNVDEQEGEVALGEWFPYSCKAGTRVILYL